MSLFNLSAIGTLASDIATGLGNLTPTQQSSIVSTIQGFLNPNQSKEDALLVQAVMFANMGNTAQVNTYIDQVIAQGVGPTAASTLVAAKTAPAANLVGLLMSAKSMIDQNM